MSPRAPAPAGAPVVAGGGGGPVVRGGLLAAGTLWVVALGAIAVFRHHAEDVPAVPRFLLQCSCLFPHAADYSIEYRVQGFACDVDRYVDMDHRSYFPVRPDDKENTFERVGHFYRHDRQVMVDLDHFLVAAHNRRVAGGRDPGDGIGGPIGGIRFISLRGTLPPLGAHLEPYRVRAVEDYPPDRREGWYLTSPHDRKVACARALSSPPARAP